MLSFFANFTFFSFVFCFALACLCAFLFYFRNKKLSKFSKVQIYFLSTLRFFSTFLISCLLFSIFFKDVKKEIQKPILAVLFDNSSSVLLREKQDDSLKNLRNNFEKIASELEEKYNIKYFSFGENLNSLPNFSSLSFNENFTNFSDNLENLKENFKNSGLQSVVLLSDGLYNRGENASLNKHDFKIYSLALGDSTEYSDAYIGKIFCNQTCFIDNEFPVEFTVNAKNLAGQILDCKIVNDNNVVFEKKIRALSDNFSENVSLMLKSKSKGLKKYTVKINPLGQELIKENNSKNFSIDIVDNKQKILILASAIHPDINAIRSALENDNSLDCQIHFIDDFKKNISDYDMAILYNLPNHNFALNQLKNLKIPVLYIVGSQTDINQFNNLNLGLKIDNNNNNYDETFVYYNQNFNQFELESGFFQLIENTYPLTCPFGNYTLDNDLDVVLWSKIKDVKTNKAILAISKGLKNKNSFLVGEGIWRLRMDCYKKYKNFGTFDRFFLNFVRHCLKMKSYEKFVVDYKKENFEGQPVMINAKILDDNDLNINNLNLKLKIADKEYQMENKFDNYSLRIDDLKSGEYQFEVSTFYKNQKYSKKGAFVVDKLNLEIENLQADYNFLRKLSSNTNANFYNRFLLESLKNDLLNNDDKSKVLSNTSLTDLSESKFLFFLIGILLAAEWFFRKFWGSL